MSDKLRELQLTELRLFKKFDEICRQYGITYYALGGTLLGAVRHKGFIPWDDDMDIGVPRPDYDRLSAIFSKELDNTIHFHDFHSDPQYIRYFGRLEDTSIKIIRHDNMKEEHSFAWIDIFPLDGMPNNMILRTIWKLYVLFLRMIYRFSCFDTLVNVNKKNRPWYEKALIFVGRHFSIQTLLNTEDCLNKLEKALTKFPYEQSNYLVNAMGAYKFKEMFHKKVYGEGSLYAFEDIEICGPVDFDTVCRQLYGDYMQPPAEEERNHHGLKAIIMNGDSD
ncbi:LicD family protein [Bariatricus massiliensis]|uniref:LicD family protein n=1 Tax=Bariatricus massiliensis TaxID=1745713 RepID=A0ABS8DDK2_9FIRM|nr:LicD family protein [Bariatricus massiliensis]MCB7302615.1 LicD family protein [Bariatricus massiliensis]MCB7373831.1 LicD family protein [Bariatricus massiliensis]MCB7386501.1 LicD family protein [Bariatricus massiliensis]MCB7410663.1 LicD family protein [Bariatricus massiliensis]MCQ5253499.1 LicD family protein [Bariatricus massiliensis]